MLKKCLDITDDAFRALSARTGGGLRHVDLLECKNITDVTVTRFGQVCAEMEILRLSGKGITDVGLAVLASGCSRLAELELTQCEAMTNTAVHGFARLTNLRALTISSSRSITDQAFGDSDVMTGNYYLYIFLFYIILLHCYFVAYFLLPRKQTKPMLLSGPICNL